MSECGGPTPRVVAFSAQDIATVIVIANERNNPKEARGVPSYKFDPTLSEWEAHLAGVKAEAAVAKLLGVKINRALSLHGDSGRPDLTLPDGRTIEVKHRRATGWYYALVDTDLDRFVTDLGVLVWPHTARGLTAPLAVVGYCTREDFRAHHHLQNFGYGERACLGVDHFRPIEDLLAGAAPRTV